jgi:methionine synthase I (cobalamin-dependent)
VSEYFVDHRRVFDAGSDAHTTTAFAANTSLLEGLQSAYSVEKLRFRTTEKFVMNFIAQAAQFTVAFLASEALLDGFS